MSDENSGPGDLTGRAAVVTGAASGVGRAIATRLEAAGVDVLAVDLDPDQDGPGSPFTADLTDAEANAAVVAAARERFGRLDIVVANAGIQHVAPVQEFPLERWNAMLALMLTSPFLLARAAWPALVEAPQGRFIAIASAHALAASPYKSAYVAAKHGVLGLTKVASLENAPLGIRVNTVCPGAIDTPMIRGALETVGLTEAEFAPVLSLFGRFGRPEEVAEASLWLCSDAASYVTGAILNVDAGYTSR